MPKRQKAKVRTTPKPTEKVVSAAKEARIIKQMHQTNDNKTRKRQGNCTPWETAKAERHAKRKIQGKTYENWRKANSSRYDDTKPTASNLLVSEKRVQNHKLAVANKPVVAANGDIHYMGGTLIAGVDF